MPNWTYNTIRVRGEANDIKAFLKKYLVRGHFDFNKVIPEPKRKKDCPAKFYRKDEDCIEVFKERPWFNWYNWRCANWGTKWNACDTTVLKTSPTDIDINFSTAWSAPEQVLDTLKKQNPHLRIDISAEYEGW